MGLFEGRSRVKRATTAPLSNLTLDVFIGNSKLGKRASKARLEPPEPDDVLAERPVRINGGFLPPALRSSHRHRSSAADDVKGTSLTNGHGEPSPPSPPSPPPASLRKHKSKYMTELQKLMVDSECEILDRKLRHIPGRISAAPAPHRNGERPRRRHRPPPWEDDPAATSTPPAKQRMTLDNLFLRDNQEYYKVEILSGKLRSSRRLSGGSDSLSRPEQDTAVLCDAGEAPDDSCDSFRVVRRSGVSVRPRRARFGPCGTPHGCRPSQPPDNKLPAPATSSDDSNDAVGGAGDAAAVPRQIGFAFESVPDQEQWFQTYVREQGGQSVMADVSGALATARGEAGPRLPYQMSQEELHPPQSASAQNGGRTAVRPKPRRLHQLSDGPRLSPRCHASTRAARCSVDAAEGVALWDSSLEQIQLVAASISSLLTEAQEARDPCSLAATAQRLGRQRRRRRTGSLSECVYDGDVPAHLAGVPLSLPEPPELTTLLRDTTVRPGSETVAAVVVAGGRRRRAGKRRKNRTGWPRGRSRRAVEVAVATARRQRLVSRAAAAARATGTRRHAAR